MELQVKGLSKRYGKLLALDNFEYNFTPGVYGILGQNGAGKSTLLNLLTDNLKRTQGQILWQGQEILSLGWRWRAQVGYMPQAQGTFDSFSARRYLAYMAELKGLPPRDAKEQIEHLLAEVNLAGAAHRKIGQYSGGMRQRVFLAQALLGDPKILILDEPTAGLDPYERIRIRNMISTLANGRIIILATHLVSDIECIANRVLLFDRGVLKIEGTPEQLIRSVRGKVGERLCTPEQIAAYQSEYAASNIFQRADGHVLRLVADALPEGFKPVASNLGLEDVFLYYCSARTDKK